MKQTSSQRTVDLSDCEKEPIRIPGCIQPHGLLIVLQEPDLTILQISSNSTSLLGISPEAVLQQDLAVLIGQAQAEELKKSLLLPDVRLNNPQKIRVGTQGHEQVFDGSMHRMGQLLILELERLATTNDPSYWGLFHTLTLIIANLQLAADLTDLCQRAAREMRALTGYDRVMIYRFNDSWNGTVIAEDRRDDLDSFLDLRFPASDIPPQARELYEQNWLRMIVDVDYRPIPIVPSDNPLTHEPLDLGFATLRSVSAVHIEYLKNMGVGASLSISLLKEQVLWGLIACHHTAPRHLSYEVRTACELVGQIISSQLAAKERVEDHAYELKIKTIQTRLLRTIPKEENAFDGLVKYGQDLLDLVGARGIALCFEDRYAALGVVPPEEMVKRLVAWLEARPGEGMYHTNSLPASYAEAEQFKDAASGLLALPISKIQGSYVLWFRPEVITTVTWAGDPNAPVSIDVREKRLHPRKSFEHWKETIRLTSESWKNCELMAAFELRSALVDMVLRDLVLRQTLGSWLQS